MKMLSKKRCVIGEGPIWSVQEKKLYFTNGMENEICIYDVGSDSLTVRKTPVGIAAFAFDTKGRLLVSHADGVHFLSKDGAMSPVYDEAKYQIRYANDMKVGPDGALYVGTQSGRRKGVSDLVDGKLYRIAPDGEVRVLLDGLILSNGMEWSIDETKFYHTDSDTDIIREYDFDKATGDIVYTGRELSVEGVDGFTIAADNCIYATQWGRGCAAVIDTEMMQIRETIPLPSRIPASCGFCGEDMRTLAVTTATYHADLTEDVNAGFTVLLPMPVSGRAPYLFG